MVNPSLGSMQLTVESTFDLHSFVDDVQRVGYRLGPAAKRSGDGELLTRMGVCIALALNAAVFTDGNW